MRLSNQDRKTLHDSENTEQKKRVKKRGRNKAQWQQKARYLLACLNEEEDYETGLINYDRVSDYFNTR